MTLEKAKLEEVGAGAQDPPQPVPGSEVAVQFNPTSLRYQLANNVDMGKAFGRSATQATATSSATLQFDLVFDTADQDKGGGEAVDVRDQTKKLEKFVLPQKGTKSVPPRVKFTYGTFSVIGVISALNEEYDLFSDTGVPLRAKVSVTIKEQKPEFDVGQMGAGANQGAAATPMDPRLAGGSGELPDRTGTALGGESASDFASRMGLDPSAWTSFAAGLSDTLSLAAGLRIDFSASASIGGGLGVRAGATAGAAKPSRPGGTGGSGGGSTPPARDVPPAEAAAAGGVAKAIEQRAAASSTAQADATRAAFDAGPSPAAAPPSGSAPAASPRGGPAGPPSEPAAAQPPVDSRAVTYGAGVPLRRRVGGPTSNPVVLVAHNRCGGDR